MSSMLTMLPPAFILFSLALVVLILPHKLGHLVAVVGGLLTAVWLLGAPAGEHLPTLLFGFEAVLFNLDVYSRLLGVIIGFIAAASVAYGVATGADRRQTAYALAYIGAGLGAVMAGDWLTLIVFWELMAVCATVLIWHRTNDHRTGIRYAIYHEIGGLALIGGVLLHYAAAGTFLFEGGITGGLSATLVALGIGLNAGFLGLHVWLVDTYPRTHIATSVVLAAITTKVGAYTVVRAFPDGHIALAYMGGAMVLFGVTFAIVQTDMRRLLSYHIVSQVGYMIAGFGVGTTLARAGALAHLVNNILYKSLLFMVAGILIYRTGKTNLKKLGGLGNVMPVTAGIFLIAALSIAGLPGFNGFISKGMVLDSVEKAGFELLWYALVIGGVGTVISFVKFGYYAFLDGPSENDYTDLGPLELVTLGSVAALCILIGVLPALFFEGLPSGGGGAKPFASKQFLKTGGVTIVGIVVFFAIQSRLRRITPLRDLDVIYDLLGRRLRTMSVRLAGSIEDTTNQVGEWIHDGIRIGLGGPVPGNAVVRRSRGYEQSIGFGILAIALVLVLLFALLLV